MSDNSDNKVPEALMTKQRRGPSLVWIVPIVAIIVAVVIRAGPSKNVSALPSATRAEAAIAMPMSPASGILNAPAMAGA